MSKPSYSIYNILETIRMRPGMYVGGISLKYMKRYLDGYERAMMDAGVEDVSSPEFYEFHEFVRMQYNYYETTAGWANMILAVVIGLDPTNIRWENYDKNVTIEQHKESIDMFYELLDEFRYKIA